MQKVTVFVYGSSACAAWSWQAVHQPRLRMDLLQDMAGSTASAAARALDNRLDIVNRNQFKVELDNDFTSFENNLQRGFENI